MSIMPTPPGPTIIVAGPESSATRLWSQLLRAHPSVATVHHRSFPYGEGENAFWPDLSQDDPARRCPIVVCTRDRTATELSQRRCDYSPLTRLGPYEHRRKIEEQLTEWRGEIVIVSYEALLAWPRRYFAQVLRRLWLRDDVYDYRHLDALDRGRQREVSRGEYNLRMTTPEVWLVLPSANPAKARACNRAWQEQGYRTAFLLNGPAFGAPLDAADLVIREREYRGWGNSINHLCTLIGAPIVVGAGDDMTPHPTLTAGEIGLQFLGRFPDTFGVMQPTGDRWGDHGDGKGALADRICGSPWMGRTFIERWNQGTGPFWHEYFHFYADEEMKVVTERAGILWQRPDIIHDHDHWMRNGGHRPQYMKPAQEKWNQDKAVFQRRAAANFPGHEPLMRSTYTPALQASLPS